jgi:hypothetical protein
VRVALDDGAGLVAVEPRHEDVAENQMRLVVIHLGKRVEAVFREKNFMPTLFQKISALRRMVLLSSMTSTL